MSVINKVLRDLDQRASAGGLRTGEAAPNPGGGQVPAGVVAVPLVSRRVSRDSVARWWPVPVLLMGVAAGAFWWWQGMLSAGPQVRHDAAAPTVPVPEAPAVRLAADPPAPLAPVLAAASAPAASETPDAALSRAVPVTAPAPPAPAVPVPPPAMVAAAPPVTSTEVRPSVAPARVAPVVPSAPAGAVGLQGDGASSPAPALVAAPRAPVATDPPPLALVHPVPWTEAALEAVAQAQRLWSSGARDTALAFLRDALAGVERTHGAELAPDRAGAVAGMTLVRELLRMEQLMANHAQVLALLQRHEALWARQADLWAVRASAAQRLSQHAEATESYRTALRLRPGEPRWMLGAAVSLAAQGQVEPAARLLEQARAAGPVSPDVLSYLGQLGVRVQSDNPAN